MNLRKMEEGIRLLLEGMGVDANDQHFLKTPQRVARMYKELLTPDENNWTDFESTYDNLVLLRGHKVVALCPHHLMPAELRVHVAYIPNKKVLGLSKLARVVESQLTRPVMQEELGELVVKALHDQLEPKAAACIIAGTHGCMKFRGVRSDADTVTSAMRGQFLLNPAARQELQQLIGRP